MTANVGKTDRVVRIVAGLALLSMLLWVEGSARWWGLIGLVPLGTGLVRWCLVYTLLGINSRGSTTAH